MNFNIWSFIGAVLAVFIPISWDIFRSEYKELTICEERQIDILDTIEDDFILYTKDSIKLENYHIIEYSITNTGNTTIVGVGIHSDLLVEDNKLQIASDSVVAKISNRDESLCLIDNYIRFKQIRPGEKIILVCFTNRLNGENQLIRISDRDIKDTNIVYTKRKSELTTFEKTTPTNRWISVGFFLLNLSIVLLIVAINYIDMMKGKGKGYIMFLVISFLCLIYTLLLPIRWLL